MNYRESFRAMMNFEKPELLCQFEWGYWPETIQRWHSEDDSGQRTQEVGTKRANPWGLYDMYGNVAEWVHDYYGDSYYGYGKELDGYYTN